MKAAFAICFASALALGCSNDEPGDAQTEIAALRARVSSLQERLGVLEADPGRPGPIGKTGPQGPAGPSGGSGPAPEDPM